MCVCACACIFSICSHSSCPFFCSFIFVFIFEWRPGNLVGLYVCMCICVYINCLYARFCSINMINRQHYAMLCVCMSINVKILCGITSKSTRISFFIRYFLFSPFFVLFAFDNIQNIFSIQYMEDVLILWFNLLSPSHVVSTSVGTKCFLYKFLRIKVSS